jgi:formate-dependent phosphoribosylglycinamide formyltransferase (GAR transformylase)
MQRLLLLSTTTGYQARSFREAAARMGVPLALASDRCHVLEDPWRDGAVPVRFEKPQESALKIAAFARENPISGLVAIGDPPVLTAALAARELGIAFHPAAAVEACRNKYLARERYRAAGLPAPWYTRLSAREDLHTVPRIVPFPCVLKPLGLSASRGVIRADTEKEFLAAFRRIRALLQASDVRRMGERCADWIQVESYIPGCELAVEGILTRGRLRILAIFDKPDPLEGPYFEETLYVTPSRLPASEQAKVEEAVRQAAQALGLWHGPLHAELRLNAQNIWVLEIAARPIGGLCSRALRFREDGSVVFEELILRHALGEPLEDLPRERAAAGVMMIPIPRAGILEQVNHLDEAAQTPGVEQIEITAKTGQKLVPLPEGASYLGFIFARGESPEFVEAALRQAHAKLDFVTAASLPVL